MTPGKINRREFIKSAVAGTAAASLFGVAGCTTPQRKRTSENPNILFIMSDQHNARALGCYGNPDVETPNLDRLAASGVRFDKAFCQTPQSCPSRMSILTGRYAHSHGLRSNGVLEPEEETTIAEVLRDSGYATGGVGKMHLFSPWSELGFDHEVDMIQYLQFMKGEGLPNYLASGDWLPLKISGPVGVSHADNDHHRAGFWAAETIKFLRANKDKPFCAWCSFYGPHTPIVPSLPWAEMYDPHKLALPGNFDCRPPKPSWRLRASQSQFRRMDEAAHRHTLAYYYGLISQIDFNIGRVLHELDALGLAEKTIVIYTADHGEMASEFSTWTKGTGCFDATVRVPLILSLPGVLPKGKVVHDLVGLIDLMPTFLELTGHPIPKNVHGRSLLPLIRGHAANWRDVVFSEAGYPGRGHGTNVMARTQTHKYVRHTKKRDQLFQELFDLEHDPWECVNQIENPKYADALADLKQRIDHWNASTEHAPMYPVLSKEKQKELREHPERR